MCLCSCSTLIFGCFLSFKFSCRFEIIALVFVGTFSQLASLQQKSWSGEDQKSEGGLLNEPNTPTPPNQDPPWTLLTSAHKQPKDWEPKFEQESSISRLGKQAMEGLESSETGRAGISKTAGQGNGGGVSNYYRPTHRGSPRPTIHDHFDINEHLPWMIVLLLLLVLVVIVVCSVKRSSRVLKKGPMQDPSSIMEKSIQKKSSAPPTQVREKWIYCCNGQGKSLILEHGVSIFYLHLSKIALNHQYNIGWVFQYATKSSLAIDNVLTRHLFLAVLVVPIIFANVVNTILKSILLTQKMSVIIFFLVIGVLGLTEMLETVKKCLWFRVDVLYLCSLHKGVRHDLLHCVPVLY